MRAISLWQPWATLIAVGAKRVETRHWAAPPRIVGSRIAIHAAKTTDWLELCEEEPFCDYVTRDDCPLGVVVATAVLDRCRKVTAELAGELERRNPHEFAFGNYYPDRFAWVLKDLQRFKEPVPFRGAQGFFEIPDALLEHEPPYIQESLAL